MRHALTCLLVLALGLGACGEDESGATTEPSPAERPDPTTVTSAPDATPDPPDGTTELEDLDAEARETVESAMTDLAERTGEATDAVTLVTFEDVTWNDGSLGCPKPGEMYTQALVDGSRTVLELDGVTYDYHAGADGDPFLCENPPPGPGSGSTVPSRDS